MNDQRSWQQQVFAVSIRKREKWRWIARALAEKDLPRGRSLDVGAGVGTLSVLLEGLGGSWTFLELDAAAAAETRAIVRGPVQVSTLEAARYPDASFDLVTAFDLLEHLEKPEAFLREVARVLVPGGTAIFTTPADEGRRYVWRTVAARLFGITREAHGHVVDGFSRGQLQSLLEGIGLRLVTIESFSGFFTEFVEMLYNGAYRLKNAAQQGTKGYNLALSPASAKDVERHARALRVLRVVFPVTRGISLLDRVLPGGRGYEYGVVAQKTTSPHSL